jgi:hypothetical protein
MVEAVAKFIGAAFGHIQGYGRCQQGWAGSFLG